MSKKAGRRNKKQVRCACTMMEMGKGRADGGSGLGCMFALHPPRASCYGGPSLSSAIQHLDWRPAQAALPPGFLP
jgi:hypothetical protein